MPNENPETQNHLHQVKEEPSYEIQYYDVPDDQPYPADYASSAPDSGNVKKTVPKRDRSNGCKRWTRETTRLLLNFIKDHPEKLEVMRCEKMWGLFNLGFFFRNQQHNCIIKRLRIRCPSCQNTRGRVCGIKCDI